LSVVALVGDEVLGQAPRGAGHVALAAAGGGGELRTAPFFLYLETSSPQLGISRP
jgi:hypothetical protein